jgi:hypothetical protein
MTNDTSPPQESRLWYFLPLIAPLVIIITFVVFYAGFLHCPHESVRCSPLSSAVLRAAVTNKAEIRVVSYVAKAIWTLVVGMHTLACLAALLTACMVIKEALSDQWPDSERIHRNRRIRLILMLVITTAANIALSVALWFNNDAGAPAPLLLRATVARVLPAINVYISGFDALSLIAVISLCFAASAVLWRSKDLNDLELSRRMQLLRYLLYMGAVLLVIGVLRLSTTLNWGASFIPSESATGKLLGILIPGIVSSLGTYYTLLMAAMYLPAALILRARARELVNENVEVEAERDSWLSNHGLTLSYVESLPRIIAILAPLMAGPFFDIMKHLIDVPL